MVMHICLAYILRHMRKHLQGPADELVMDKGYRDSPGRFTFTSEVPGEHIICLHTTGGWFGAQMMVRDGMLYLP